MGNRNKKRLVIPTVQVRSNRYLEAGQILFTSNGKVIGKIVNVKPASEVHFRARGFKGYMKYLAYRAVKFIRRLHETR